MAPPDIIQGSAKVHSPWNCNAQYTLCPLQALLYLDHTITELPGDTLPSKRDVLRLYRGREGAAVHCARVASGELTCSEPTGCLANNSPCIVFSVKELWVKMRLPVVSDKLVLARLKALVAEFHKFIKKKLSEAYATELDMTFNLTFKNYEQIVMESDSESEEKARKIRILNDFVGPNATRYFSIRFINEAISLD